MPDPAWTMQYQMNQTPEGNGFTRSYDYTLQALVNAVTGGSPANRRVELDARGGTDCGVVFLTSNVPSLDYALGATAEMMVNVSGAENGDAGVELTFLNYAVLLQVYPNKVSLCSPGIDDVVIATPNNNADLLWRITFDPNHQVNVYRAGNAIPVIGSVSAPVVIKPYQRVLWWAEGGVLTVWKALRYYVGGAVAAG